MGLEASLGDNVISTTMDRMINWARKSSLWPMPFGTACCAIEMMATLSGRFDLARFGAEAVRFSPRQSDLLIVSGRISIKMMPVLKKIYDQMPDPKWVISMGACASSGGVFNTYTLVQGVDQFIPVDVYLPGCPPRPEDLIHALMKIQDKIDRENPPQQLWPDASPMPEENEQQDVEVADASAEATDAPPEIANATARALKDRFADQVVSTSEFQDQWTAVCRKDQIREILTFLRDDPNLAYDRLNDVTAVDWSEYPADRPDDRFTVVYNLFSHRHNHRFRVKALVSDDDCRIASATSVWKGANWPEREVFDMFGVRFEGHPDLRRILMPVDFRHHPLRKDYPLHGRGERDVISPEDPGFEGNPFSGVEGLEADDPLDSERMILNLGPQHPATHGTLRLTLELEGEEIIRCIPDIGYLHTGFEKLAEHHNFNQWVTVTDRMNYLSPLSNNIGYARTVERLLGLEVPPRANAIRVILSELSRIADHMVWLGTHALDIGAMTVFLYTFEQRELLYNIFEAVTGARLTTSYTRIGGLGWDVPANFQEIVGEFVKQFPKTVDEVDRLLTGNRIWVDRTKGIGVISAEDAIAWNITGPMLRGSGVDYDLRKTEPYMGYEQYDFEIPVGSNGDVYDRYLVRMEELRQSVRIIEQATQALPNGPVKVDDAKVILPEKAEETYFGMESLIHHFKMTMDEHGIAAPLGEVYDATESPNGELGWYVVSNGTGVSYRTRVRPPSFMNYQSFPEVVKGHMIADAVAILGSANVIAGELDR